MRIFALIIFTSLLISCGQKNKKIAISPVNWDSRGIELNSSDSLTTGSTYLSVYSEIYQVTDDRTYNLTVTVSLRNINTSDTVYILNTKYYNTHGELIKTYSDHPIYIKPLETLEIVIAEADKTGGTGGNFIFDWATPKGVHKPYFEAVMISTTGQQGLSFTTQGIVIQSN